MMTQYSKGFTLIELMVSLTLALIIMLSAMQLLLTNQMSFNLQSGMGNVQENGRFALDYINSTVRSAEYSQNIATPTTGIIMFKDELPSDAANKIEDSHVTNNDITLIETQVSPGVTKNKGYSDQLVTRMWISQAMIDGGFRDCEGNTVTTPGFVVTRYFVRADLTSNNEALACDAGFYQADAASVSNYKDNGVVLLSTIDSFQVLFGVSAFPLPTLGQRFPVQYMTAKAYTDIPVASRPAIVSLRIGLVVRSNEKVNTGFNSTPEKITVLDKEISGSNLDDKFVHRLFTSTLALRNAI